MKHVVRPTIPLLAILLSTGACRSRPQPETTPATVPAADTTDRAAADSARARAAREADERARQRDRDEAARLERERMDRILTAPIHFEFDRSDLTLAARANLDAKLEVLRGNPQLRLRMEGHADERGSQEYNLSLGMRRAAAARRYLMQRDIAAERLDTGSMGEERPLCEEASESCWQRNRRAEFTWR